MGILNKDITCPNPDCHESGQVTENLIRINRPMEGRREEKHEYLCEACKFEWDEREYL